MCKDGHARGVSAVVTVDYFIIFAINAAIDGMDEPVAAAAARILKERGREDAFAAGCEHDFHRVVHASRHDRFDAGAVGPAAKDMRGPCNKRFVAGALVRLLSE